MTDNQSTSQDSSTNEKGAKLLAQREESPFVTKLTQGLGAIITLIVLTWAIEFWLKLGFEWFDEHACLVCLGLTLAIIFVRYPYDGGRTRLSLPWYDAALAILGAGSCFYLAYIYGDIEEVLGNMLGSIGEVRVLGGMVWMGSYSDMPHCRLCPIHARFHCCPAGLACATLVLPSSSPSSQLRGSTNHVYFIHRCSSPSGIGTAPSIK